MSLHSSSASSSYSSLSRACAVPFKTSASPASNSSEVPLVGEVWSVYDSVVTPALYSLYDMTGTHDRTDNAKILSKLGYVNGTRKDSTSREFGKQRPAIVVGYSKRDDKAQVFDEPIADGFPVVVLLTTFEGEALTKADKFLQSLCMRIHGLHTDGEFPAEKNVLSTEPIWLSRRPQHVLLREYMPTPEDFLGRWIYYKRGRERVRFTLSLESVKKIRMKCMEFRLKCFLEAAKNPKAKHAHVERFFRDRDKDGSSATIPRCPLNKISISNTRSSKKLLSCATARQRENGQGSWESSSIKPLAPNASNGKAPRSTIINVPLQDGWIRVERTQGTKEKENKKRVRTRRRPKGAPILNPAVLTAAA